MVQIVTNILPHLSGNARPQSELKSRFVILLGEGVAEVVWAALREVRGDMTSGDGGGVTVLSNLFELQKALDAPHTDKKHVFWVGLLQKLAKELIARIEAMVEKNPAEWSKPEAMPEGCEIHDRTWTTKLTRVLERALHRTLRRQPTRRVDIYDQFVGLWLEREIRKVMGQRGVAVTPQQLQLEVSVFNVRVMTG